MFFLFYFQFNCRTKAPGAHLASVHNLQDNNYLLCIVKKFNPKSLRIWLGAYEFFKVWNVYRSVKTNSGNSMFFIFVTKHIFCLASLSLVSFSGSMDPSGTLICGFLASPIICTLTMRNAWRWAGKVRMMEGK